jgi:hypothetical protein
MNATPLLSSVRQGIAQARIKIDLVTVHGTEAFNTGVQTLEAARSVVIGAGNDTAAVFTRARQDLKHTLSEGASKLGHQLVRIATPTHAEQAALRKDQVRKKKRVKKQQQQEAQAAPERPNP